MYEFVNAHQAEAWNGYEGRHWADNQGRYDVANGGMNAPLLDSAAVVDGECVLDIGCGNGQITRLAAGRTSAGRAVGIDLSAPMLERARVSAAEEGVSNVEFIQGDAQVHPFEPGAFDIALSRGGIMFFADPVAAFANIATSLRPGGRLVFACPQSVTPDQDFARALAPLWALTRPAQAETSESAPGDDPGPTSLADPATIESILGKAGFVNITVSPRTVPMVFGHTAGEACDFFFAMGPMRFNLSQADPDAVGEARRAVTRSLGDYDRDGAITFHAPLWFVHAIRPGV